MSQSGAGRSPEPLARIPQGSGQLRGHETGQRIDQQERPPIEHELRGHGSLSARAPGRFFSARATAIAGAIPARW